MPFNQHKLSIPIKQSWLAVRSRFLNQFSSSSGRTYFRRQSGFAAERKQQTCATQENGSPARRPRLGWEGECVHKELPFTSVSCVAFILIKERKQKLP